MKWRGGEMATDATLEILLTAKNQSEAAFKELKTQLGALQQEVAKTAKATESSFNFDKMKAGFVAVGASAYGAFQAISRAIDMAGVGTKLEKQSASFGNLADAAGSSSKRMLDDLRKVSRGLISEAELIGSSGKALLMGISPAEITKLMEIAAATSRMTGQTMTEAFADITLGVARQSRLILDNLGIIIDVDKAYENYAKTLGKTADSLSDTEKRQAFMTATMKAGEDMIKRLGSAQGSLEGVNKLVAAQANLWDDVTKTVAQLLDKELSGYAKMLNWIDEKLKGMRAGAASMSKSEAWKEIEMLRSLEEKGMAQPGSAAKKEAEYNARYLTPQFGLKPSEELKRSGSFTTPAWNSTSWREREGNYAPNTEEQNKAILKQREDDMKAAQKEYEDWMKADSGIVSYGAWEDQQQQLELLRQELVKGTDAAAKFNMELYKKAYEGDVRRLEKEIPFLQKEGLDERINDVVESVSDGMDTMVELSQRTAEAMQSNFSDLFFDAMTGKLKSLEDYFNAIMRSIQRAAADMAGQMLTEKIFGAGATGGKSGGSGGGWLGDLGGWLGGLFSSGSSSGGGSTGFIAPGGMSAKGNAFDRSGLVAFARGGVMDRPTVFPFARGVGLMGEAGPEAIMPLRRDASGRLGVSASAPSSNNITINVAAPTGRLDRESLNHLQTALASSLARASQRNA
jgi:hypothetical protein